MTDAIMAFIDYLRKEGLVEGIAFLRFRQRIICIDDQGCNKVIAAGKIISLFQTMRK